MSSGVGVPNEGRTVQMTVDNIGFMLDRLGQDCSPLQFLRELTQNSIEAIAGGPDSTGEVIWDADWNRHTLTGIFKLACIDTGVGMTGEEMHRYINMLSSSVHQQSHHKNFGVGAKIAAATRNHAGLLYLSWKDGKGAMVHLWRDPTTGQYGLQQIRRRDGSYSHWAPISDDIKPDQINDHGTMVILLGNDLVDDTMQAPKDAPSPSRWVARYLNTRYFKFPEGVVIRARQGWEYPRDSDTNNLARLTGQKEYLDSHAESAADVSLTGATAHWWILRDEAALSQNSGHIASNGHMAALYQDELYEMVTARGGVARLQQFGVIFGYQRVVIYVQPTTGRSHHVVANTARTHLLVDNEPLPWAEWAAEFRERMPAEIASLMEEVTAGASSSDHRQAIKDRLKQVRDLFKISRYRRTASGPLTVESDTVGGKAKSTDPTESPGGGGGTGGTGGRAGDIYALFLADEGDQGEETDAETDPTVQWVSAEEGTRTPPDLDDRAAKYLPEGNLLLVNRDFRGFADMVDRWWERYDRSAGARPVVRDAVEEWFEQALIETVIGVQSLHGSPEWTVEDIAKALSQEALTATVMQRYHIEMNVRRTLGSKLGSLKERVVA